MMYLKTNNMLSTDGVLVSAFKGFGQGAIATIFGRDVGIPSTARISAESRLAMTNAIAVLQQHRAQYPNAQDELDEFIHHPEIIAMTK